MLLTLIACAYEVPADPGAAEVLNVLEGTVVLDGDTAPADTVILIYPWNAPPPPTGTGRPISFATIPADAYDADAGGVASADWALTEVPNPSDADANAEGLYYDGDWLVTALMDVDGNFQPLIGATAGSTCGDWLGAYYSDISAREEATIHVEGGQLLDGISVVLDREMPTQRPTWQFVEDDSHSTTISPVLAAPFSIAITPVHSDMGVGTYDIDGPYDGTTDCQATFWQYAPDEDGDGVADPHPNENFAELGYKSLWPRVYLRYSSPDLPPGEYYGSEAIAPATAFGVGMPPVNTPTPLSTYDLLFAGKAIHFYPDGTEEIVEGDDIPKGEWSVTVVQYTGQTWTLPNELADYPSTDDAFDPEPQGHFITIE